VVKREKRRSPRIPVESGGHGRLRATVPVTVIDVSSDGMQIEVAASLRPGSMYDLKADVNGIPFAAQVRITRCCAGGYLPDGKGGRFLLFRAGAEFVRLDGDNVDDLISWVNKMTGSGDNTAVLQAH
jgi:hypothetical protein